MTTLKDFDLQAALDACRMTASDLFREAQCTHNLVRRWRDGIAQTPPAIVECLRRRAEELAPLFAKIDDVHARHPFPDWRQRDAEDRPLTEMELASLRSLARRERSITSRVRDDLVQRFGDEAPPMPSGWRILSRMVDCGLVKQWADQSWSITEAGRQLLKEARR